MDKDIERYIKHQVYMQISNEQNNSYYKLLEKIDKNKDVLDNLSFKVAVGLFVLVATCFMTYISLLVRH